MKWLTVGDGWRGIPLQTTVGSCQQFNHEALLKSSYVLQDMSSYVKKVHFKLHESYANPLRGKRCED